MFSTLLPFGCREYSSRFELADTTLFCLRVMVGVIILYDHIHPVGAFAKTTNIDVSVCVCVCVRVRVWCVCVCVSCVCVCMVKSPSSILHADNLTSNIGHMTPIRVLIEHNPHRIGVKV